MPIGYANTAGIASDAVKLQTPRTISLSGDVIGSVSFDGSANVSIAATIQPNSVALGSDTTGDYVQSITGTTNQISVDPTSGESSTPVLSIPNQFTAPQDVTVSRDLQVNQNLNVNGNITIGGTVGFLNINELRVKDKDIILGITTNASNQDVSTDITANHGGIAIASTEGFPLVDINGGVGTDSIPFTYKQIMWLKSGSWSGLNTDAWLFNYAVGIGSTQFPAGTRLAAGSVQFTQNDLTVVRNINASGVITAASFIGTVTNAGAATSLKGGSSGSIPYQSATDTTVFLSNPGVPNKVLLFNGTVPIWGDVTAASGSFGGISVRDNNTNVGTSGSITTLNFVGSNISATATTGSNGIATITIADNLVGTALSISGISTLGTVQISSGIITSSSPGIGITFYGSFIGTASTSGYATTAFNLDSTASGNLKVSYASTAGISTNVIGGIASVTQLNVSGITTLRSATLIGGGTSTGTSSQVLQVAGINSSVYIGGNLAIGTTNPTSTLQVGTAISMYGTTGFVSATRYYGDGSYLTGLVPNTVTTSTASTPQYIGFLTTSSGITTSILASTTLVYIPSSGNLGIGTTNPTYNLHVNGSFGATTKSFIIKHPTKKGKKLQYGSLEGPELGVYVRGRTQESIIELPEYWTELVDEETITVNLTAIGRNSGIHNVLEISNNTVIIESTNNVIDCFYTIFGERKDVAKLEVEISEEN